MFSLACLNISAIAIILIFRMNVDHEIKLLVQEMKRLGSPNGDGNISVKFGVLFSDDKCANLFEGIISAAILSKHVVYSMIILPSCFIFLL